MMITFILPGPGHLPSGGFKVVYEYSNRLVARGHEVTVVHKPCKGVAAFSGSNVSLKGRLCPDSMLQLKPRMRVRWVPNHGSRWVPNSGLVVATAWHTAEWVTSYPAGLIFIPVRSGTVLMHGCSIVYGALTPWSAMSLQVTKCSQLDRRRHFLAGPSQQAHPLSAAFSDKTYTSKEVLYSK
jgi:hypothetical protein